jgi:hypothetical protein
MSILFNVWYPYKFILVLHLEMNPNLMMELFGHFK